MPDPQIPTDASGGVPTAEVSTGEAWRHAPLRNFLISQFLIMVAFFLQGAALGKQVFDTSGREVDIAWIGLAEFVPAMALVLVTGWVADHVNRKLVALVAVGGEVVCALVLVWYVSSEPTRVWPYFVLAGLFGAFRAFSGPAMRAMPPMVAPPNGVPKAITLSSVAWTSASIFGPAISGMLLAIRPAVAFGTAAVLFVLGALWLTRVRLHPSFERTEPVQRPTLHTAVEGLRFIRRTPMLLAAISLDLFAVLFGGAVALLPAIAEDRLHVGNVAYGWLRAAPGIGAAAMGVVLASRPMRRRVGSILLAAVAIFGGATVVLGLTRSYVVAFIALLVLSAADMISVVVRGTLVPLVTPDDKRGRVLAVEAVFIGASNELGAFESGIAAQAFGVPTAVVGGGLATIGVVGVWAACFPVLRRLNRYEDLDRAAVSTTRGNTDA